jgi:hypothetical protein
MGLSSTRVELSHVDLCEPPLMRGEYAGVLGSESMNVPKDCADMGGDMGLRGVREPSLGRGDEGRPMPGYGGERLLRVERAPGDFGGTPWGERFVEGGKREFPE